MLLKRITYEQIIITCHSLDKQTEQTKPMFMSPLWQKQAAFDPRADCLGKTNFSLISGFGRRTH